MPTHLIFINKIINVVFRDQFKQCERNVLFHLSRGEFRYNEPHPGSSGVDDSAITGLI